MRRSRTLSDINIRGARSSSMHLGKRQVEIISDPKQELSVDIVNFFQKKMRKQYGHRGLRTIEDVEKGYVSRLSSSQDRFVQILREENHYFTVSNMCHQECNLISIFDSKSDSLPVIPQETLALVYNLQTLNKETNEPMFMLDFVYHQVTQQLDEFQSGCMALAYAQAICSMLNPSDIRFSDDPWLLRSHLLTCSNLGKMFSFPTGSRSPIIYFELDRPA